MCSGESGLGSGVTFPFPVGGRETKGLRRLEGHGPPQSDQSTPQYILAWPSVLLGIQRVEIKKAGRRAERREPRPAGVASAKSSPAPKPRPRPGPKSRPRSRSPAHRAKAPPRVKSRPPAKAPPRAGTHPASRVSADLRSTPRVPLSPSPPCSFTNQSEASRFQAANRQRVRGGGGGAPGVARGAGRPAGSRERAERAHGREQT